MRNFPLPLVLHHALNPLVRSVLTCLSLDVLSSLLFLLLVVTEGLGHGGFSFWAEICRRLSWLWGPGDICTQLSASGHCTDRSAAEAQHWRWPSRGPVTSIPSLRHFSALIRSQVLSPPNIVSLISPLLSSAKCLTFSSRLTSSFTWMQCNFGLKN